MELRALVIKISDWLFGIVKPCVYLRYEYWEYWCLPTRRPQCDQWLTSVKVSSFVDSGASVYSGLRLLYSPPAGIQAESLWRYFSTCPCLRSMLLCSTWANSTNSYYHTPNINNKNNQPTVLYLTLMLFFIWTGNYQGRLWKYEMKVLCKYTCI
jgi:hypothetical protein